MKKENKLIYKGIEYKRELKEDSIYMFSEILDITDLKLDLQLENTKNVEGVAVAAFANIILNISKKIYKAKEQIKDFLCFIYNIDREELTKIGAVGTIKLLVDLKNDEDITDFLDSLQEQPKKSTKK